MLSLGDNCSDSNYRGTECLSSGVRFAPLSGRKIKSWKEEWTCGVNHWARLKFLIRLSSWWDQIYGRGCWPAPTKPGHLISEPRHSHQCTDSQKPRVWTGASEYQDRLTGCLWSLTGGGPWVHSRLLWETNSFNTLSCRRQGPLTNHASVLHAHASETHGCLRGNMLATVSVSRSMIFHIWSLAVFK